MIGSEQLDAIAERAVGRAYAAGDVLYEHGAREAPFIVLLSGRVEFFDRGPDGDRFVATLLPGTFIGDLDIFTGEPTLVACVAAEDSRALVMSRGDLRRLTADRPDVADLLLTTMITRRDWLEGNGYGQCRVLGTRWSREAFEIRELLGRNLVPHRWVDVSAPAGDTASGGHAVLLEALGVAAADLPVLVEGMSVLRRPDLEAVAHHFGLRADIDGSRWDVAVVGAGPAGLAAAVYSASEGLSTVVLDAFAPGGQAGTSSRIENYLGFPTGVSGGELTRRAVLQARRFGALISSCHDVACVERVDPDRPGRGFRLKLADGQHLTAHVVVIATGAVYRRLDADGADRFDGAGVYYAASHTEAVQCTDEEAVVVGGGNSAGQAAMHLARYATRVHLVVRGDDLGATMSAYLVDRVRADPRISVQLRTRLTAFTGEDGLEGVTAVTAGPDGDSRTWRIATHAVFVLIGAAARSGAVRKLVATDRAGFLLTGPDAAAYLTNRPGDPSLAHHPQLLETTEPGVLAAGDIRCGSTKRIATAVGDGAMAVRFAHESIARTAGAPLGDPVTR